MPSRVLETVLTGRNLLSPVLTGAARDVEVFDGKVTAANARAGESASTSAARQEAATAKITAANAKASESASTSSAKTVAANARSAESARAFADVSESSAARAGVAWTSLATKALPIAAAAAIVVTGKMAGDYQQLVTKLETTAGELPRNLSMVSQGMLDMAGKVGLSATELAKGMYTVESAGFHGRDGLLVLKAAAQGAVQEQADLGKVTDATSTILHDYHMPASDAAKVTSQLITAVSHGKTTFDELTGSLHSVTPLAAKLHLTLADVTGTLSAMTASGESADQATQNMADTLRHLANPTSTMIAELSQLGISTNDLQKSLDQRGLAGTLQMVEEAIVQHLDPATQRVLLPALNKSKSAVQDLHLMMGQMPPDLAKLSQGLMDGSVSIKDYQKSAKDLGGQQGAMALQFLSLLKNSQGFNNVLKAGGPAAQVFTAAMAKSIGTTAGLNVMLQTTGENAAATNAAIKDIGAAQAQADGSIKGWAEVQGNLNQKLAEAGAEAKSLAIEAGDHLLPALTAIAGWVASDGLPAIGHLGSAVGGLGHLFGELPGPVKDAAYALAALKLAEVTGLLGKLGNGTVYARVLFSEFGDSVRGSMGKVSGAFREAKASSAFIQTLDGSTANRFTGTLRGIGAAAGEAAKGGLSVMKSAGSGLVNLLGGPWGVALAGATIGVGLLTSAIADHKQQVQEDTDKVTAWYKAISSEGGQAGVDAMTNLRNKRIELADAQAKLNDLQAQAPAIEAAAGRGAGGLAAAINLQKQKVDDLTGELTKGQKAAKDYWDSLTPQGKLAATVAVDEANLALAIQQHGAASSQARAAVATYNTDLAAQKELTGELTNAEQSQIDKLNGLATAQLGAVSSALGAAQAQSSLNTAIGQYNKDAHDGQHSTSQLADESRSLAQQAIETASAVAKQAVDQAAANGKTDDGTLANATMLASLKEAAKHITGPGHDALMTAINDLEKTTVQHNNVADAASKMGLHVEATWDHNTRVISGATKAQITDLENLGYKVTHLPDGKIVVSTDTGPARKELDRLIAIYKGTTLTLAGNYHVAGLNGQPGGTQTKADGGPIIGPGTGTSDTAGLYALSNGEHVWTAAETQAAGGHAGVESLRKMVLAAGRGRAAGGPVGTFDMYDTMTAHLSASAIQQAEASIRALAAMTFSGGGGGAGSAAIRSLGMQIASSMGVGSQFSAIDYIFSHESGWNPTAQNPTSTAYGIPQFLDSTWGPYGGKTSSAGQQIRDGILYMENRYGSPNNAAAFWQAHHWYDNGGILPQGLSLAVNGTGGDEHAAVFTNPQWAALQHLAAAAMPGYGTAPAGPGIDYERLAEAIGRNTGSRSYTTQVTNTGTPLTPRKIVAAFQEMEFLAGG